MLTPSSYGLQPWKFLVIQDQALRQELRPHSWNQSQITDCSHLVVLLSQRTIADADADRLIEAIAEARGLEASSPDDDLILNLEASDYRTCMVCALGYRSPEDKYASLAKVRFPATELIEYR